MGSDVMNTLYVLLMIGAGIGAVWFVVSSLLIYDNLGRRGQKVNFLLIRLMLPWYVSRYREITKSETGKSRAAFLSFGDFDKFDPPFCRGGRGGKTALRSLIGGK
jgi:hypothetical protein